MKKQKQVKPERAWCVEADGELCPTWTNINKARLTYDLAGQRNLLGDNVKIVRVEVRKVKPKKRKSNAR